MCYNLRLWNNSSIQTERVANTGEAPELDAIGVSIVSGGGGGGATIIIVEAPGSCGDPYLVCLAGRSLMVSVSESIVMEVVSPAVSGREVAGNCIRMV